MDERKFVQVDREEFETSFSMVSSGTPGANQAWISIATGKIKWRMESGPIDEEDEQLDDEAFEAEGVIEVPHAKKLDLGRALVMRFAREVMPNDGDEIYDMFRRRGAYGRFKEFLASRGMLERWYKFEDEATKQALLEWCEENDVVPVDRSPGEAG